MRKIILVLFCAPVLLTAQPLQFELQPGAFPASINGWQMYQPWAGGMDDTTPELCDIDNDGDLDFFCGSSQSYISYFENKGNINFANFQYITYNFDSLYMPYGGIDNPTDIDFADINGDSMYDAFIGGAYVFLYYNNGTANSPNFIGIYDTLYDISLNIINGTHVSLIDIDQDGDYDLFAGHYTGYIKYYENIGTSTNYAFQLVSSNWFNTYTSEGYTDPCFADLDADGDLDLLVGTGQGKIYYYQNQGTAQNPQMVLITNNFCNIDVGEDASPELADIDGDGDLDLLVGRDSGTNESAMTQGDVYYYENIGTPQDYSFQFVTTNYLTFDNSNLNYPNFIDIDGDGDADLLTSLYYHILFYRNQGTVGNPNFVYETDNFGGISVFNISPWFRDIDGDGDYDLFCGTSAIPGPPGLYLFLNQGTPQSPNYVLYSSNIVPGVFTQGSAIIIPGTADIDTDGDQDLFVSDMTGHFYFWENIGTPTQFQFQFITSNWQNIYTGINIRRSFCFYDIDHDGDLDLFYDIISASAGWSLGFYRNVGTPQVANMVLEAEDVFPELYIMEPAPYLVDIDRDGDGDLFVGDGYGGIRFFRNLDNPYQAEISISISGSDVILTWGNIANAVEYRIFYQNIPYFIPTGVPQVTIFPPDTVWMDYGAVTEIKKYYRVIVEY